MTEVETDLPQTEGVEGGQQESTPEQDAGATVESTPKAKSKTGDFIEWLKGKLDEKDSRIQNLEQEVAEIKKQKEIDVAVARFGQEVVTNETVVMYKEKYPDMSYEECMKLAGVQPSQYIPPTSVGYSMPWRAIGASSQSTIPDTITAQELEHANNSNPSYYKLLMDNYKAWKLKVV